MWAYRLATHAGSVPTQNYEYFCEWRVKCLIWVWSKLSDNQSGFKLSHVSNGAARNCVREWPVTWRTPDQEVVNEGALRLFGDWCLCRGDLSFKLNKNSTDYDVPYFNLRGLELCFLGAMPTKTPLGDGTASDYSFRLFSNSWTMIKSTSEKSLQVCFGGRMTSSASFWLRRCMSVQQKVGGQSAHS